jgi:hypothetical protein
LAGSRTVIVQAQLKDNGGGAISNKTLSFAYKPSSSTTWTNIGTATTDDSGMASVNVTVTTPGTYDFQVSFAGDSDYEASTATATSVKIKGCTVLTISVTPAPC